MSTIILHILSNISQKNINKNFLTYKTMQNNQNPEHTVLENH